MRQPPDPRPKRAPLLPWAIVLAVILIAAVLIPVGQSDVDRSREAGRQSGQAVVQWLAGNVGTAIAVAAVVVAVYAFGKWRDRRR